jgi:hypothetical protein
MATTQSAEADKPSFDTVWAAMDRYAAEAAERFKELERVVKEVAEAHKETERAVKETAEAHKETERAVKETAEEQKKTAAQMKETDKKIGKLGSRFGEAVEYMVMPNLVGKFRQMGFFFTKAYPGAVIEDEKNRIIAEIDITLENGDKVMIVEVKSKPNTNDVKDHLRRMAKVRRHADLHGDQRKFLGAVAGMVMNEDMRKYVLQNGFFAIEPSGDTFNITMPEGKYHPREW